MPRPLQTRNRPLLTHTLVRGFALALPTELTGWAGAGPRLEAWRYVQHSLSPVGFCHTSLKLSCCAEHGDWSKCSNWELDARVPLIIRAPSAPHPSTPSGLPAPCRQGSANMGRVDRWIKASVGAKTLAITELVDIFVRSHRRTTARSLWPDVASLCACCAADACGSLRPDATAGLRGPGGRLRRPRAAGPERRRHQDHGLLPM